MADYDASIVAHFGGDTTGLKNALTQAEGAVGTFATGVSSKLVNLRQVGTAVATALGLNLKNIADSAARYITGISKAEEEAYKQAGQLSDQLTELVIKNNRARLSEEQRFQLLLQDRDRLQKKISESEVSGGVSLLELKQQQIELEKIDAQIIAQNAKVREESNKQYEKSIADRIKANEDQFKSELASLEANERIAILKEAIAAQQALIASGALDEKQTAIFSAQLQERQNALVDEEAKLRKEAEEKRQAFMKRAMLSKEEEIELTKVQLGVSENLKQTDRNRYDILVLQRKEKGMQVEIDDLILKKNQEGLTPEEEKRLKVLIEQGKKIREQIVAKEALLQATSDQVAEEKKAAAAAAETAAEMERQAAAKRDFSQSGGVLGLRGLGNRSTTSLELERDQIKNRLEEESRNYGPNQNEFQLNFSNLISQLNSLEKELSFRRSAVSAFNTGGAGGVASLFEREGRNASALDTVLSQISSWQGTATEGVKYQQATNDKLDRITNILGNTLGG